MRSFIEASLLVQASAMDLPRELEREFGVHGDVFGAGTYGQVIAVVSHCSGQWFAAKLLEAADCAAEVAALRALKHRNLVELLHLCRYKGKPALVFEAADLDLQRFLRTRGRPLTEVTGIGIAGQVAAGLSYIHQMQWMHRDLKTANVLVRCVDAPGLSPPNMLLQIADFGWARKCPEGGACF